MAYEFPRTVDDDHLGSVGGVLLGKVDETIADLAEPFPVDA
jgi:hypothetical protein